MIDVRQYKDIDAVEWDTYVNNHPDSNLYHLSGWKRVIEKTYGHSTYYLMAINPTNNAQRTTHNHQRTTHNTQPVTPNPIRGILPLVHLKHFIFGNSLISMPFFDMGGVLADNVETERALLDGAVNIGVRLGVDSIELRHTKTLNWLVDLSQTYPTNSTNPINPKNPTNPINPTNSINPINPINHQTHSHKVRMLLELPESSEMLMKSFKSKLRSQIKKPIKEGLSSKIGGIEFLEDFYKVFTINMRDLGSPVHSKKLVKKVVEEFSDQCKIVTVYKEDLPVASSVVVGFKGTLENPWASSLRQYSRLSPNMLLYWNMLVYACENGYSCFDFGRSTPGEGTHRFKKQWGAVPDPLNWLYIFLKGEPELSQSTDKSKFERAISYWQKLPVPVTKLVGPRIRKYIGL